MICNEEGAQHNPTHRIQHFFIETIIVMDGSLIGVIIISAENDKNDTNMEANKIAPLSLFHQAPILILVFVVYASHQTFISSLQTLDRISTNIHSNVKYFMCEQKRDYCMADSKILKRSSWQR
jgi:hypothetical protein